MRSVCGTITKILIDWQNPFYTRDASHSAVVAAATCLSVCLSHADRAVFRNKFRRGFWERGAEGAEDESPQATRPRRRRRRGGGEWGWGVPLSSRLGGLGSVVSSTSAVRAEPRPKTDLMHSTAVRKPLVAIILNILKCMFFTRKLNN